MNRGTYPSVHAAFAATRPPRCAGAVASTFAALLVALPAQGDAVADRAALLDRAREPEQRLAALVRLQDRGQLDVAAAVAAMAGGDDEVARSVASIVRHEWFELPDALFRGLDDVPAAARALLQELAVAPRPAASAWAAGRSGAAPGRTLDDRLLAVAASGLPLRAVDAELVLQALVDGGAGDGLRAALAVLPSPLADAQLGRLHAAFAGGRLDVARAAPLLDRLSPRGLRQLLGPIVALPPELATALCEHLHQSAPELLAERVAAALDDPNELATCWLPYAAPHLDVAARRERLLALLADPKEAPVRREYAFLALATARCVAEPVLEFATEEAGSMLERVRRLLAAATDELPAQQLLAWLAADEQLAAATVAALSTRRQLPESVAMRLVDDLRAAGVPNGRYLFPAAMAVVLRGPEAAVRAVWPLLQGDPGFAEFVDALARRPEPFAGELLAASFPPAIGTPVEQAAPAALALAARGVPAAVAWLLELAPTQPAAFVRRCAHHVPTPPADGARALLMAAGWSPTSRTANAIDEECGVELVAWAAGAFVDAEVAATLRTVWTAAGDAPADEELREVALRALLRSPERDELVAELRTALAAGPLPERFGSLAYEVLAGMHERLLPPELALCVDLVLLLPRTDPEREAEAVARWPLGTSGFPLVAAVAQRLRGNAPAVVGAAFAAAVPAALADPRHRTISLQRLLLLWRALGYDEALQAAVGAATAPLALAVARPEDHDLLGPVHWFAMHEANTRGDLPAAVLQANAAVAGLLRLPQQRGHARVFLGERDPGRGVDPWAALAAMPHRLAADAAHAASDAAAEAAARTRIREFAGRDHATLASLPPSLPETQR
ncbi:MAG: hypothetical protein JNL12_02280 [Planctomycetes bacterium]|nr:hypothetical protein [Planctomycetota bacterium]